MVKLPIKTLLDNDRKPFIPYVPMEAIPVDGTGRTLIDLHNALKKTLSEGTVSVPVIQLTTENDANKQLFYIKEKPNTAGFGAAIEYEYTSLRAPYTYYLIEYLNNAITSGFTQVSFFLTSTEVLAHYKIAEDRTGTKRETISVSIAETLCGAASVKTNIPRTIDVDVTYNDEGLITAIESTGSWYGTHKFSIPYNNRIPYEPEYDYSPASKKYVDEHAGSFKNLFEFEFESIDSVVSPMVQSLDTVDLERFRLFLNERLAANQKNFYIIFDNGDFSPVLVHCEIDLALSKVRFYMQPSFDASLLFISGSANAERAASQVVLTFVLENSVITSLSSEFTVQNVFTKVLGVDNANPDNVFMPTYAGDPATKQYVDNVAGGGSSPILVKELVPTQAATQFGQSSVNLGSIDRDNLKALANEVLAEGKTSFILIVAEKRSFKHAMVYSVIIRTTETYRLLDMCCIADYDGTVNQLGKTTMNTFYISGSADVDKITALDTYHGGGGGGAFYIPTNNTVEYMPTKDYHPATKKYVDDAIAAAIASITGS